MQQTESVQTQKRQSYQPVSNATNPSIELAHSSLPAVEVAAKHSSKKDISEVVFEIVTADKELKTIQLEQLKLVKEYFELSKKLKEMSDKGLESSNDFELDSLRRKSITTEININKSKLLRFSKEYLGGNPIGANVANGLSDSLSVVTARSDFSALFTSFSDLAKTKDLNQVFEVYNTIESKKFTEQQRKELMTESIQVIDAYIKKYGHLYEKDEEYEAVSQAFDNSQYDEVFKLTQSYFSDVTHTELFKSYEKMARPIYENLASRPAEELEKIGIVVKRNADIFSETATEYLNALLTAPEKLSIVEREKAEILRKKFWDTSLPWVEQANGQTDIRALITSVATLKRLSESVSALETKLEEIGHSGAPLTEASLERKKAIDTLWEVYFSTSKFIVGEYAKEASSYLSKNPDIDSLYLHIYAESLTDNKLAQTALQGIQHAIEQKTLKVSSDTIKISKILGDPGHPQHQEYMSSLSSRSENTQQNMEYMYQLAKPYAGLVSALHIIQRDVLSGYTPEMYADHVSLIDHTLTQINPAFNQITEYLKNTGVTKSSITHVLNTFVEANQSHPEIEKLKSLSEQFTNRFARVLQ